MKCSLPRSRSCSGADPSKYYSGMSIIQSIRESLEAVGGKKKLREAQTECDRLRFLLDESRREESRLRRRVQELEDVLNSPTWLPQA